MLMALTDLKKEHFNRALTNGETIKRDWMLYSETTGMAYSVCRLFADRETNLAVDLMTGSISIGCMNIKTASHTGMPVYLLLLSRLRMHEWIIASWCRLIKKKCTVELCKKELVRRQVPL